MTIVSALPGQTYFGVALARILPMNEHSCRVQKMPSHGQLLKEHKKRTRTPHRILDMRFDDEPKRIYRRTKPHPKRTGWRPKSTILTAQQVLEIYAEKASGKEFGFARHVGQQYGVDRRAVQDIWSGRSWSDVTGQVRKAKTLPLFEEIAC